MLPTRLAASALVITRLHRAMLRAVNCAQLLIPDFSLILCGYLVCRYTPLNRAVWQPVESLVYYLLFPVLLFQSIVKSPIDVGEATGLVVAGVGTLLCGVALAYSLPHLPWLGRHIDRRDHAAAAQVRRSASTPAWCWPWPSAWPAPRVC